MSLFHLVLESEWRFVEGRYTPRRFEADGFVHCCDGLEMTRAVAAAYFARATEPVLVVELNEAALDVPVKREAPAPPDGQAHAHHDGRLFPHVYGSIPVRAVVRVTTLTTLLQES
ncbi:MAG TPA: DUF952 domain-containing protein [Archangium sp.]